MADEKATVIRQFEDTVRNLKQSHMYVDSKLEIDKNGKVTIMIKADNEPR